MGARWGMPVFGLAMGALMFGAAALGGQPVLGLGMLAVMAVYGGIIVAFGGRSETIGVLGGRPVDERLASLNLQATAIAGTVAIVVAIGGFLVQTARGQDASAFALVAAAAGVAYIAGLAWLQRRG